MISPEHQLLFKAILHNQKVAALATLHEGEPFVSMTPFAVVPGGHSLVIHVSSLATHTKDMLLNASVGMMVMAPEGSAGTVLALPRVSVQGRAHQCRRESAGYEEVRQAYLDKFPESLELFGFGDFSLFTITPESVRFVAGFGRAMSITPAEFASILAG